MENKMRGSLNEIYFGKTKDVVNDLRYTFVLFHVNLDFILANYRSIQGTQGKAAAALLAEELQKKLGGGRQ